MAIHYAPESAIAKELWKWDHTIGETHPLDDKVRGMRPIGHQEYPKMLVKVARSDMGGQIEITEELIAHDSLDESNKRSRGWLPVQEAADELVASEREIAVLAANRAHHELRMSDAARAEAQAYEAEADGHVPVIPETPIQRRRKTTAEG